MQRIQQLLDSAILEPDIGKKVETLYIIKELSFCHGVDNYVDAILAFQSERHASVKKFVVDFIEALIKHDCSYTPKVAFSLNMLLLAESSTDVTKRAIQASSQFYTSLVKWTERQEINAADVEQAWLVLMQIKKTICNMLDSANNDGIRTNCVKCIETIILMQTQKDKYTDAARELNIIDAQFPKPITVSESTMQSGYISNQILFDENHKSQLIEEAKYIFEQLVSFHGTSHISSVNLMAAMQTLVVIAKQRSQLFMGRVIQAMESLHNNLPPTLTTSQVQSVKKFLKLHLTIMLKHQYSMIRYRPTLIQLLQDIGTSQSEINKIINDFKHKVATSDAQSATSVKGNEGSGDTQKRIKLEAGVMSAQQTTKSKQLNLNKLTKEMDGEERSQTVVNSVKRILEEERRVYIAPAQMDIKKKVLSVLANEFHNTQCPSIIQDYIFQDLRNRHEIVYAIVRKNFEMAALKAEKRQVNLIDTPNLLTKYFDSLHSYIKRAMECTDIKERDFILPRIYAECPYVTDDAIRLLEVFITESLTYPLASPCGIKIIVNLIEAKPELRQKLLLLLVELSKYDQQTVKEDVEKYAKELYESQKDNEMIKLFLEEELLSSLKS